MRTRLDRCFEILKRRGLRVELENGKVTLKGRSGAADESVRRLVRSMEKEIHAHLSASQPVAWCVWTGTDNVRHAVRESEFAVWWILIMNGAPWPDYRTVQLELSAIPDEWRIQQYAPARETRDSKSEVDASEETNRAQGGETMASETTCDVPTMRDQGGDSGAPHNSETNGRQSEGGVQRESPVDLRDVPHRDSRGNVAHVVRAPRETGFGWDD